jgi:hypothetical protein
MIMKTVTPNTKSTRIENSAESKQMLLKDIGAKWSKFSEKELSALKSNDDLVAQVVAKYSMDKTQAKRDVDAVMKSRQI